MIINTEIFLTVIFAMVFVEVLKAGIAQFLMDRQHNQMMEMISTLTKKAKVKNYVIKDSDDEDK